MEKNKERQTNIQQKGRMGEEAAAKYLIKKGFQILARNFHSRYGEIDLIVQEKPDEIVFVEVKTYKRNSFIHPLESITQKKIDRMEKTAESYLIAKGFDKVSLRFDLIVVRNSLVITHMKNFF
ncbi:YraN family protein [Candidatus Margulisiibacteriota bacterium]